MSVYDGLVADARLRAGGDPAGAVAHHVAQQSPWLDSLVVPDALLSTIDRLAPAGLRVCVVNSGGAGGLLALARRTVSRVRVVAVESELRDLDDLAGNAARVAAAAGELPDELQVYVGLPASTGWERAVDVVEAAGLAARITLADFEAQAPGLVEADLSFAVVGGHTVGELDAALVRVLELVEGASVGTDPPADWPAATAARVRRRLRRFDLSQLSELSGSPS